MSTFGDEISGLGRELVKLLADPFTPGLTKLDLEVAIGSRNDVLLSLVTMYAVVVPPHTRSGRTEIGDLERHPAAVLAQALNRPRRPFTDVLSPSDRQLHQAAHPSARHWQQAARHAFLAADHLTGGDTSWLTDPAARWQAVAMLADAAEAIAVLDEDLTRVAAAGGHATYAQQLHATSGTGLRAAAAEVARTARSGVLDDRGMSTSRPIPTAHEAVLPLDRVEDLAVAQQRVAAQLDPRHGLPGPTALQQIAIGQVRAHLSVVRILHAAGDGDPQRRADYLEAANACHARAHSLADIAATSDTVASLLGTRGDLRAVQQTGEILRLLTRAETGLTAESGTTLAPHVLAFARAGGPVVTAIDNAARTAVGERVYLVPNTTEGIRGAHLDLPWVPAVLLGETPEILDQTGRAVHRETGVSAALERVGQRVGAWDNPPPAADPPPDPQLRLALDQRPRNRPESDAEVQRRWRPVVDAINPAIPADPRWPALAVTLDRAQATGFDVHRDLPFVATGLPLPARHPVSELQYRLLAAYPAAGVLPDVSLHSADPSPRQSRDPDPVTHDARRGFGPPR